ncbi:TetR/AcrR family transcriptional regulator [Demequina sp. NBRC 110057]|uniref:TetR/AcrR family transcriptional regulator n=1 Tax=Demequina sp. NBRC 110057 TaxID=1570346 RepID=UPI000A00EDEA|nr:TetR/AcrR family transcriptional regulator [Demequina sp. NBRC 110057]
MTNDDASSAPASATPARRSRPHGKEPVGRDRILEAAAVLFVEQGYAATTTRQISAAVNIKQPSLYYHFPNKAAMLNELLIDTAKPSIAKARELLADEDRDPLARLLELIRFDVHLLASGPSNIGALYLLPETNEPMFGTFQALRQELVSTYGALLRRTIAAGRADVDDPAATAALLFSLVEGVILRRADDRNLDAARVADGIETATLRILGATL